MSDGRAFTDYSPRCAFNGYLTNKLAENNMIKSSYEMRLYLQQNYDKFVEEERAKAIANITPCGDCGVGDLINDKKKELGNKYEIHCDGVSCYKIESNFDGLGTTKLF
jgi:collagenase-like PrtC family protease